MSADIENAKFKLNQKLHYPYEPGLIIGPLLNLEKVKDERIGSLNIGTIGKSHFAELFSEEIDSCPVKKVHVPKVSAEIELRGKKYIPIPKGKEPGPVGVRKIDVPATSDTYELDMPIKRKIKDKPKSVEYNMETTMNRKQRVDAERQRNYIPAASSGDKYYKEADREPGFYKVGGVIVGSTIVNRKPTSKLIRPTEEEGGSGSGGAGAGAGAGASKTISNTRTHFEKLQRQSRESEITNVLSLTVSVCAVCAQSLIYKCLCL